MKRSAHSSEALGQLLRQIASSEEQAVEALDRLLGAIESYQDSKLYVDEQGRRVRGSVSTTRSALLGLEKRLCKAISAAEELPYEAIRLFSKSFRLPVGSLIKQLKHAHSAAAKARAASQDLPNKSGDIERELLAGDVARVFMGTLKRKPTATRDSPGADNPKGGAAYARVLRETLRLAGLPNVEIGPDIDAGLRSLREDDQL